MISKIFPEPTFQAEAQEIFPQLFLALLCQVSFTEELTQEEVQIFWVQDPEAQLSPIRCCIPVIPSLPATRIQAGVLGSWCKLGISPCAGLRCRS